MTEFGYWLSSEEHAPLDLVRNAARAEELGFSFAMISDHFHPWIDAQGQSPFVWSVLGGIAQATERLQVATGVTCPLIRTHPAIVAQAAATVGVMLPGRFTLGLGTGENLNEHVLGDRWPAPDERIEMLEEAIEVIRLLWAGGEKTHRGKHYTVDHARLYTLPEQPIPIAVAAVEPARGATGGQGRRRARHDRAERGDRRPVPRGRRRRLSLRAGPDLLGRERGAGQADGLRALAPQRPRRHDQPGATAAFRLRRGRRECDDRDGDRRHSVRPRPGSRARADPDVGAGRLRPDRDSTRSGPTRTASSASGSRSCNPSSADWRFVTGIVWRHRWREIRRWCARFQSPTGS